MLVAPENLAQTTSDAVAHNGRTKAAGGDETDPHLEQGVRSGLKIGHRKERAMDSTPLPANTLKIAGTKKAFGARKGQSRSHGEG